MTRKEMLDTARRELAHIPDWPFHQRALRMIYYNDRLHSLGRKATAEYPDDPLVIIEAAIKTARAEYPSETFEYDRPFFEAESKRRRK